MKLSIVTPTYNRENLLKRLYVSLLNQSCLDFEWIIVDDGSTDSTSILVKNFISDSSLDIKYINKENGGKHTAVNLGIKVSSGEYIFVVDSDDWLPHNSIELILIKIGLIQKDINYEKIAGICGLKSLKTGLVGNAIENEGFYNYLDFRYKYKIKGDKAEIFKRHIYLKNLFPEFLGEKFCPEALVINRISKKYDMYFFNEIIYFCEYQNDGLSSKIYTIRKNSPKATLIYYYELFRSHIPIYYKIRALINYLRFFIVKKSSGGK